MYQNIFLISKNKQRSKNKKRRKENISGKLILKKICGRPGEDFSRHSHFRKQEFYFIFIFFWPYIVIFFICKRDSNTFSRNLDFCVFGESTNFKISDVIIDLTALLKLHSQPTFFCSKSTTETLKKVYVQNQQEKDYVTDVVLVFF